MTFSITATNKADLLAQVADITGTLTAPTAPGRVLGQQVRPRRPRQPTPKPCR
jgi:hypothetical protein